MKKIAPLLFIFISIFLHGQEKSIQDKVLQINRTFELHPHKSSEWSTESYHVEVDQKGMMHITEYSKFSYHPEEISKNSFYISDVVFTSKCIADNFCRECLSEIKFDAYNEVVMKEMLLYYCKNNERCITHRIIQTDNPNRYDYTTCWGRIDINPEIRNIICKAFYEINNHPNYKNNSPELKYNDDYEISKTQTIIPLVKNEDGTFLVPAEINRVLKISFIYDPGAAEVNISPDIALTLIRTGTIEDGDWLENKKYQLADGSVVENKRVNLKHIKIGNWEIDNVEASISNSIEAPMLLGQNVLSEFGKVTIDNLRNQLIIESAVYKIK